jgi:hypothetical protein
MMLNVDETRNVTSVKLASTKREETETLCVRCDGSTTRRLWRCSVRSIAGIIGAGLRMG